MTSPRVALLGTGKMGSAIASRLAARGIDLVVWNRTRRRALATGAGSVAESPAAAAAAAELVLSSLTDATAVRDVFFAPGGAIDGARGQTFVETSTAGVAMLAELLDALKRRGSILLDCPIAGTPPTVARGEALLLLTGDPRRSELATPILAQIGTVRYLGPLGTASRLKLASNCMVAVQNLLAEELLEVAPRSGLDPAVLLGILERQAPGLAVRRAHFLAVDDPPPTLFTLADMRKDLELALETLGDARDELRLMRLVRDLYAAAAEEDPDADLSRAVAALRKPRER